MRNLEKETTTTTFSITRQQQQRQQPPFSPALVAKLLFLLLSLLSAATSEAGLISRQISSKPSGAAFVPGSSVRAKRNRLDHKTMVATTKSHQPLLNSTIENETGTTRADEIMTKITPPSSAEWTTGSANAQFSHESTHNKEEKSDDDASRMTQIWHGIRHGKSISNEWMERPGNGWGDATFMDSPHLVDSPLSAAGIAQANQTAAQLIAAYNSDPDNNHWLREIELVLVSPLTRCLQTYELAIRPALEEIATTTTATATRTKVPVQALALLRERVYTCSDTGRPISILKREFPDIDFESVLSGCDRSYETADCWWYTVRPEDEQLYEEWRPFGQGQWYACPGEPLVVFQQRMKQMQRYLSKLPAKNILLVTHWGVLRFLSGRQDCDTENCGFCTFVTNRKEILADDDNDEENMELL